MTMSAADLIKRNVLLALTVPAALALAMAVTGCGAPTVAAHRPTAGS
jgi:hypothetical protein